ncbi:sugar ABC transporter permease [Nonomuraea angiospora]|uniref:sugar ABC transporter permease n=1 Tax=Nonomuraea angiospora TaxID=46172 RepID=UPI003441D323
MTSPTPPQAPSPAFGWLLAVPALFGTLISLVLPTVQTIWLSLQRGGVLRESTYVGFANYGKLLGDGEFWRAAWFTLSLVAMPLLVSVVVAPLLAVALDRAGTWPRRAGRIALSLAIVTFSPVGVAAAWMRGLAPDAPGLAGLAEGLRDPATAPGTLRLIVAAGTFGVVCALAVMAFLPALRAGSVPQGFSGAQGMSGARGLSGAQGFPGTQGFTGAEGFSGAARGGVAPAMLVVGVIVAIATVAVGLQTFSFGLVLTRGGPERSTETLAGLQYDSAFRMAEFGPGASVATLTGVILGVLGIVATVVVAASRLSVTLTPRTVPEPGAAPAAAPTAGPVVAGGRGAGAVGMAVGIVALVVFLAVALVCAWPWIDGVLASPGSAAGSLRSQVNTWVPAIGGAVVSVGVAYLAALGIGGLRPLGRGSEWLLLVFAPWLFVGTGPLGVANWQNMRNMGLIDSFLALFPPLLVSVPALLVLTLLCKGLAERTDKDFFGGVFLPSLPMAGILAGAVALVNAQDLLWPLLVAQKPALFTAPVAQMAQLSSFSAAKPDVGAATPLLVVAVALVAVVAAQLLYLDRLAITTNASRARAAAA